MAAKSTRRKKNTKEEAKRTQESPALRQEIIILCVLAASILMLISNFGLGGLAGEVCSAVLFGIFGWMAYLIPILVFGAAAFLISNRGNAHAYIKIAALLVLLTVVCALLELAMNPYTPGTGLLTYYKQASIHKNAGGFLGGCLVTLLCPTIGVVGSYVVLIVLGIICMILITEKSLLKPLGKGGRKVYEGARQRHETSVIRREERMQERKAEAGGSRAASRSKGMRSRKVSGVSFATTLADGPKSPEIHELTADPVPQESTKDRPEAGDRAEEADLGAPSTAFEDLVINRAEPAPDDENAEETDAAPKVQDTPAKTAASLQEEEPQAPASGKKKKSAKDHTAELEAEAAAVEESIQAQAEAPQKKVYSVPPLNLLKRGKKTGGDSDDKLRATARKLEETLQNFGVKVHVTNASCGPSVTRYELQPEQGVKVSKIVGLSDDIKLNLAVTDLRIEAPIPGKAAVGIEVPNSENTAVMLRDLLESGEFQQSKSRITVAVGKDIAGKTIVADIAKMPHLLVAGSTGSGKSVCINTMIMSIIYKADPEDVKLIMVDPKVVELSVYNGIPHLLIPVVTDPKKAAGALNWAVAEMMKRYDLFAKYNVRDLKGFNEKAEQITDGEEPLKKMPQIVIIVDELADLMMVAPKDVEGAICRLAQLARAAGLHLILATQRPSVNVITGLIKANMPSRIAFAVSSGVDSRTIIDMSGAEKLLGKGDMLFYPTGIPKPMRVQGSFVSDKEVQKVVEYLIENNGNADYSNELEEHMNADVGGEAVPISGEIENGNERDQYFADAGRLIIDKEKASIGMLQRMFKIGFNRAARVMDQLAEAGVVGPEEGTKPRKVLMTAEEFEDYLQENG